MTNHKNDLFDIIILAGQSNAEGSGRGPVQEEYIPNGDVLAMHSDFTITVAQERVFDGVKFNDFSLSFSQEYIKSGRLQDGRKILIVRAAVGGTGFNDHRWGMTEDLYLQMMAMIAAALELNPGNRLAALLWHQGENDFGSPRDEHYDHLKSLVESVRDTYRCPDLPFIAGDFVPQWKSIHPALAEPIVQAIRDVCNDIGHAAFVETTGLLSNLQDSGNGDEAHFSRESVRQLGIRYFEAFLKISRNP